MNDGFFQSVYRVVARIPTGRVATYGQIAAMMGMPRSSRVVGYAMRAAPGGEKLPCHRVVNRLGELSPEHVFGGKEFQRMLLEMEGVTFLEDGRVDLSLCLWDGAEYIQ